MSLSSPRSDRDACGIGFVADIAAKPGRQVVEAALSALASVRHRGAVAADGRSGDGAGILLPLPGGFFSRAAVDALGVVCPPDRVGVITAFLDPQETGAESAKALVAEACEAERLELLGWRAVPVAERLLGPAARSNRPAILQGLIARPAGLDPMIAERACYRARRLAEARCRRARIRAYFASWSFAAVTYKALVTSDRLADFYPDLQAVDFEAVHVVFHLRFSTNTSPAWERAQPFRMLGHNGEINTLQGNELRMAARGHLGTEEAGLGSEELFRPLLDPADSDSGKLDSAVELLVRGGRDLTHAVAMLVPEAWEGDRDLPGGVRDFFRYHACLAEPWDGPAGLVFTDGRRVGAALDRNGLRPLRYQVTEDGLVVCASEAGLVPPAGGGRVRRGRLGPGEMLCVDPEGGGLILNPALKERLSQRAPYGRYADDGLRPFGMGEAGATGEAGAEPPPEDRLLREQRAFGVDKEELAMVLKPMATDAREPTFSMGDDVAFAAVAGRARLVPHYLKQRFAQVTNPPIDHLRERLVMSLRTCLGPRAPLLTERAEAARLLEMPSFFIYPSALDQLLDPERRPFAAVRLDATFPASEGPPGLRRCLERLGAEAEVSVGAGAGIVVVSDAEVGPDRAAVPALLAVGAVHHRLVSARLRQGASLVVDTGEARDVHSTACLLGYGADAICPRLALGLLGAMADAGALGEASGPEARSRFQAALEDGVLKIMSKMGISTVDGYRGAQVFEALGLAREVVDLCLSGTPSDVGGHGLETLAADALARSRAAFGVGKVVLDSPGFVRHRKGGEYHANDPEVISLLHGVVGLGEGEPSPAAAPLPALVDVRAAHLLQRAIAEGSTELYERFAALVGSSPVTEIRDLLELRPVGPSVPLAEVEPARGVLARFSTGAMSHGALSAEAHETLTVAMNLVGGKSNCGEGGEDRARFATRGTDRDRNSKIKQIASGRFGVTPEYCSFADELNIKMAQGSKPGEGGHLPGHKVTAEIARLRHTQPGIGLISPPPHHDIYSIEDLAQLIYDLKQVNPAADVSVKLVAEAGVGTIAAGVAKALADVIQISGGDGGTGASPLSSIKHAGMPWELGLAETQLALVDNGLRGRVRVRVDGGLKTGRDVVVAALLGADEYSFGTAAMLAEGCIMVRACHRDTCPTGIATQRPSLRAKFAGTPEGVAAYMVFVAEETRRLLASLGLRSLDEAIGRVDLLSQRPTGNPRHDSIDLAVLLAEPADPEAPRRFIAPLAVQRPRSDLGDRLAADAFQALWEGRDLELEYRITNADRAIGAALGGAIAVEWGDGLPPGEVLVRLMGSAGQSFGAFLADGVHLELTGEANDYLGKGMGGGRIVVRPPEDDAGEPVLAGNTILYGATGGLVLIAGRVGERFCVRNSGATAVVEGCGDHACEYMTAGTVVVLGPTGYNLGAGMTGGQAYVHDPGRLLGDRLNSQLVEARRPDGAQEAELRFLVARHAALTGSGLAEALLSDWPRAGAQFWRVAPIGEVARIERAHEGVLGASS